MRLLLEIGRFFVTGLAVAISAVLVMTVISQFIGGAMSFEAFFGLIGMAFFFSVVGGVFFGLPALWVAKSRGWDRQLWKLSRLGLLAGLTFEVALTLPIYGSIGAFEYLKEVLPFWLGFGAFSGLVAAQVWFWLHSSDGMREDA